MADDALDRNIKRVVRRSDLDLEYENSEGQQVQYPRVGQGPAVVASEEDMRRDALGFTNPNLHRRVDPQPPPIADDPRNQEVAPRSYQLNIMNVHSIRTTGINVHDEDSIDSEIP